MVPGTKVIKLLKKAKKGSKENSSLAS